MRLLGSLGEEINVFLILEGYESLGTSDGLW